MSEEEKKAIEEDEIKFRAYLLILNSEFSTDKKAEAMKELLKIYNKQQKEIEELENDRDYNYISKDKIKTKIEELEKHLEEINNNAPKNKNGKVNRSYNSGVRNYYENKITVLKDLLNNNDFIYKIWGKKISDCLGLNIETTEHDYIEDFKKLLGD